MGLVQAMDPAQAMGPVQKSPIPVFPGIISNHIQAAVLAVTLMMTLLMNKLALMWYMLELQWYKLEEAKVYKPVLEWYNEQVLVLDKADNAVFYIHGKYIQNLVDIFPRFYYDTVVLFLLYYIFRILFEGPESKK